MTTRITLLFISLITLINCGGGGGGDNSQATPEATTPQTTRTSNIRNDLDSLWKLKDNTTNNLIAAPFGFDINQWSLLTIENPPTNTAELFICQGGNAIGTMQKTNNTYRIVAPEELVDLGLSFTANAGRYALNVPISGIPTALSAEKVTSQDRLTFRLNNPSRPSVNTNIDTNLACGFGATAEKGSAVNLVTAGALSNSLLLTRLNYPFGLVEVADVSRSELSLSFIATELESEFKQPSIIPTQGTVTITRCDEDEISLAINVTLSDNTQLSSTQTFAHQTTLVCP